MTDQYAGFGPLYDQMAADPALIDSSPAMLREARKKSRAVRWYRQDVTRLRLTERADAVTCHFDALNHILDLRSLHRTFGNVAGIPRDGGLFLFDLNTRAMLQWLAEREKMLRVRSLSCGGALCVGVRSAHRAARR